MATLKRSASEGSSDDEEYEISKRLRKSFSTSVTGSIGAKHRETAATKARWIEIQPADPDLEPTAWQLMFSGGVDDSRYFPRLSNSFYLRLKGKHIRELNLRKTTLATLYSDEDTFYISLLFLRDLAENKVEWDETFKQKSPPPTTIEIIDQDFDFEATCEAFDNAKKPTDGQMNLEDQFDSHQTLKQQATHICVPIKASNGKSHWFWQPEVIKTDEAFDNKVGGIKRFFKEFLRNLASLPEPDDRDGKWRARSQDVALVKHPLLIVPGEQAARSFGTAVNKIFQTCLETISTKNPRVQCKLELHLGGNNWPDGYSLLSENPFGLYKTLIHNDSYDEYMRGYAEVLNKERAPGTAAKTPVRGLPTGESDEKLKEFFPAQNVGVNPETQGIALRNHQTIICTTLSAEVMATKRGGEQDAGKIMGKDGTTISAPILADKIFGWDWAQEHKVDLKTGQQIAYYDRQMKSGSYIAEWLHLVARSWGAITGSGQGNAAPGTTQVPSNLILGTSEANSCMTRFEKAWQGLFSAEAKLNPLFRGLLTVTRNPDKANDAQLPLVMTDALGELHFQQSCINDQEALGKLGPEHGISILKEIAPRRRFLAYSVSYTAVINEKSLIFDREAGWELKTMFYPFSRTFFHRAEGFLDNLLYQKLVLRAVKSSENVEEGASVPTNSNSLGSKVLKETKGMLPNKKVGISRYRKFQSNEEKYLKKQADKRDYLQAQQELTDEEV